MNEQNPLLDVFNKISEIITTIQEKQKLPESEKKEKTPITPEIYEELENLEVKALLIKENIENIMKELGKTPEELNQVIKKPPETMPPKQRRLLERTNRIKEESEALHRQLSVAISMANADKSKTKNKKTTGLRSRGRKFRDDSKWIPL